jgi:hypothetical protein
MSCCGRSRRLDGERLITVVFRLASTAVAQKVRINRSKESQNA